jgi:hypothetical protein
MKEAVMNNLVKIGLALLLSLTAVGVVLLSNNQSGQPNPRDRALQTYLACRLMTYKQPLQLGESAQGRLPQNFTAAMSKASFGDTPYYQTTCRHNPDNPGVKPLPYPPNDLWCVKVISADPKAPRAIVVALHQDIYNADWVAHEVTDPATVLPAVGCQFTDQ